jgi:hypothetical protein
MASNWHKLFNEGDPRMKLTWKNHFSKALETAYNFYSSGEDILENANESEAVLASWDDLVFRGGRHSWVTQEIGKGCQSSVFAFKNKPCQGGWEFNTQLPDLYYLAPTKSPIYSVSVLLIKNPEFVNAALAREDSDPYKLTNESLAQFGLFRKFDDFADDIYAPINEGNELRTDSPSPSKEAMEKLMKRNETTWQLLASGVPVRSFAAGANSIKELERNIVKYNRNYDMQGMREFDEVGQPFWPEERGFLLDGGFDFDWFHTDIRDVAFPYVYEVFDKFVNIIEGKEGQND